MTQEEKARAYDEALEKARKYHAAAKSINDITATRYEDIFPVLRESEDERIRKELIGNCKDLVRMNKEDKVLLSIYEPWLAYLEKQEQKSVK